MSAELWMLVSTAVLAVVAMVAAVIAVRAVRRVAEPAPVAAPTPPPSTALAVVDAPRDAPRPATLEPRLLEGRVIVPPTQQQVVAATMGRPAVRVSILAHGLVHALRPESRDRIAAMMRRDYRRRRRERLQAGRHAARAVRPSSPADSWLGS